jgi:hypothetical protein
VTLADTYRLLVIRQEFPYRHLWEWTALAENQWTHDGRKLTGFPPKRIHYRLFYEIDQGTEL